MFSANALKSLVFLTLLALNTSAASINNEKAANKLYSSAKSINSGTYRIINAATGAGLSYNNGLNIKLGGSASPIALQSHGASSMRVQIAGTDKCLSAQWNEHHCNGDGCDWAAVLYECANKKSSLRPAKQVWLFVPLGTSPESYNIIPTDHIKDQATRGMHACVRKTAGDFSSICLDELQRGNKAFAWHVVKGGSQVRLEALHDMGTEIESVQSTSAEVSDEEEDFHKTMIDASLAVNEPHADDQSA